MTDYIIWYTVAVGLVAAELATGTFYLLMVALGFAAGGCAALLGGPLALQCVFAAIVAWLGIVVLRRTRWGRRVRIDSESNPDVLLDIGQSVDVWAWREGAARVRYRGAEWDAVPESLHHPSTGKLIIKAVRGSTLVLGPPHNNS